VTAGSSVLVRGGAGCIGSHAVKTLRQQGADVIVYDKHLIARAFTKYNLGNGRATSVKTVIDSVERVVGRQVPLTRGPRRPAHPAVL
jgi:UDP-glucose 4-epimerase